MENIVHNSVSILAGLVLLVSTSVSTLPSKVHDFTNKFAYNPPKTTRVIDQTQVRVQPSPIATSTSVPTPQPSVTQEVDQVAKPRQNLLSGVVNVFKSAGSTISKGFSAIAKFMGFGKKPASLVAQSNTEGNVLAATFNRAVTGVTFTIPAFFQGLVKLDSSLEVAGDTTLQNLEVNGPATFNADVTLTNQDLDLGTGTLTAANVLYGLSAGSGIKIGTGQTPEVSLNVDYVKSIEGLTGDVSLAAGSGISLSGTTITNSDKGSSQNIFKTFSVSGQSDIVASSNTDELEFIAGTGVALTTDATNKTLTIDAAAAALNSGWTDDGTTVRLVSVTDKVGIGTSNPSQTLDVGGLFVVDTANSFVGIGTTAPAYTLDNAGSLRVAGASTLGTLSAGATTLTSLNNSNGGITNAGAITGATGLTSSGTITFASLGAGVAQLSSGGVLSSSALSLAGSNITGTLGVTNGGTGLTSYTTGDLLYGSATNTLGRIGIGGSGQVLTVAGGIPTWASITGGGGGGGGLCPNCLITDPGTTQAITPSASTAIGLDIRQASGGSVDIFRVSSNNGLTQYFRIDSTGNVVLGTSSSSGVFTVSPTSTDPIAISPVAQGAGAYTGTITSADLTAARTWTLPNATGAICLDTGNCAGSGGNLGGSGTTNYLARWNAQYVLENGSIFDNGNVGIGTTNPLTKLEVADTAWLRGSSSTNGLYVASNGNIGIGTTSAAYGLDIAGTTNISGAVTLGSTLNVTGATSILSSTVDITGTTTIGGNLKVNGAGNSYIMGNLGLGTSSPTGTLSFGNPSTIALPTSTTALNVGSNLMNFNTTYGVVGIGTTMPNNLVKLNVLNTSSVKNFIGGVPVVRIDRGTAVATNEMSILGFGVGDMTGYTSAYAQIGAQFRSNSTALLFGTTSNYNSGINQIPFAISGANVGVGTTNPTVQLDVSGEAWLRGALNANTGLFVNSSGNVGIGLTNPSANLDVGSSATTGNGVNVTANSLSTGNGMYVNSTSTGLTSGNLMALDWSPGSSTTATGDVLSINVGANGIIGNIFNVKDNGTSVFSVSQTAITAGLPVNFTAPGDVNIAYDLLFTNQTSGNIKSLGPLAIEAGEAFESNFLTLRTFNAGQLVLDLSGGLTMNQAQNWTLATARNALTFGNILGIDTTNSRLGVGTTFPSYGLDVQTIAWLRGASGGASGLFVTGAGNVGIGITNAFNKLDVSGSVAFGSLPANPLPQSNSAYFSGQVGIGTTSPAYTLDISGTARATTFIGQMQFGTASEVLNVSGGTANLSTYYPLKIWNTSGSTTDYLSLATGGKIFFKNLIASGPVTNDRVTIDTISGSLGIGTTSPVANLDVGSTASTGTIAQINANSLSTGKGLYVTSTSTALSTGSLASIDWSPGSSTTATGDLLSVNVGANGIIGNIFNVKDNGTSVFSVSQTAITAGLPVNFTAPGDVGVAYDLNFTNQTASYIKSNAPLVIEVGESWESNDLTLRTFNAGQLVLDLPTGLSTNQSQRWTFATGTLALNINDGLMAFDTTNARVGIGTSNPSQKFDVGGQFVVDTNRSMVGIGTTGPRNKLEVSGSVAFGSLPGGPLPQSNSAYFSGSVGIGTSNPAGALHIRTGQVIADTNAAGTPTYSFFGDSDTGLYSSGNDIVSISSGAVAVINLNKTTGITAARTLSVHGATAASVAFIAQGESGQTADILQVQASTGQVLSGFNNLGSLGVGTSSPRNMLDVSGSVAFGSLPGTALPQANSAYFSGRVGIGTTNPSTSLQIVGGDCSDDAGGAGCTADYAELYPSSENVEKGDVLMIDPSTSSGQATVKRANKAYAHNLIGIVSTNPAAIAEGSKMTFMNTEYKLDPRKPAVALAGRVPVKVDPESAALVSGDMLTSSNKPGMAMKATQAGQTIGKALEAWTPGSGKDKVLVFVNNTWADPQLALNETGEVNGVTSTMNSVSPDKTDNVAKDLAKVSGQLDTLATSVNTLDSKVSGVSGEVEKLVADNSALQSRVNSLDEAIKKLQDGAGSILGVGVGSSSPDVILSEELSDESKDPLATADSLIDGNIGKFSDLQVTGLAKLNDINVIGNASIGFLDIVGMDLNGGSNIDTITGPLRLQATAQNTLEIMNGKVIVSKEGNITTTGEITAKKLNILTENTDENGDTTKSDSSIGTGTLLKGKKSVVISTKALTRASKVFITPKTLLDYPLVVTGIKAGESFTVEVKSAEDNDVDFDWFIVN